MLQVTGALAEYIKLLKRRTPFKTNRLSLIRFSSSSSSSTGSLSKSYSDVFSFSPKGQASILLLLLPRVPLFSSSAGSLLTSLTYSDIFSSSSPLPLISPVEITCSLSTLDGATFSWKPWLEGTVGGSLRLFCSFPFTVCQPPWASPKGPKGLLPFGSSFCSGWYDTSINLRMVNWWN